MRRLLPALAGCAALAALPALGSSAAVAGAVVPFAAQAPDSAFSATAPAADPVACQRPAPDNRVSTTIHCYTPDQIRAFYGLSPLTASTTDGAGQTIVLVDSYGTPTAAEDAAFFAQTFGGPAPDVTSVFPLGHPDYTNPTGNGSGTSGPTAAAGWAGEASLDVQWAYAIAPKAHIVLLATPPAETQGVQGLPNLMKAIDWAVATYPAGTVFSMSFGTSEEAFAGSSARQQFAKFDQTFQRGLAKHDTFFASSGDDGSLGVARAHHQTQTVDHPSVSYPNTSPYVTSVGGTQVQSGWTWAPTSDKPFLDDGTRNPAYWAWTVGGSTEAVWNVGRLRRHLRVVSAGRGADSRRQRVPQGGRQGRHRQPERGHLLGRVQPEHRVQRHRGAHLRHRRQWRAQEQPDVRVRRRRHGPPRAGRGLPDDHGLRPHHRVGQPQGRRVRRGAHGGAVR